FSSGRDEPAYDSKINKATSAKSAAAVAAGARARHLALPSDPECQRRHRTAMAHRARAVRGAIPRATGDRRALPYLEPQHGGRAGAHGRAGPGGPPAPAARSTPRARLTDRACARHGSPYGTADRCDLPPPRAHDRRGVQCALAAHARSVARDAGSACAAAGGKGDTDRERKAKTPTGCREAHPRRGATTNAGGEKL